MNGFDLSTIYDLYVGSTQHSAIYYGSNLIWELTHDFSRDYLTIESLEDNNNINYVLWKSGSVITYNVPIWYSTDGVTWSECLGPTENGLSIVTLNAGEKVYLKNTTQGYSTSADWATIIQPTNRCKVYGNIMSLIYGDNFIGQTSLSNCTDYTFFRLFSSSNITDASNLILHATTLADYCYTEMFSYCTSLSAAPELPATTLADNCYENMFHGCTALTTAPSVLPATTLTSYCYENMFRGCTRLTTAPELPATTLADNCYENMFQNCTRLTTAPELPATTLTSYCYESMFIGCTALDSITCLATDISATNCTLNWVSGVAATGTFIKDPNMTDWTTGISGIPSGWTVEDYSPLPYDYEVEYLQGDGKAYINLGIPISTFYNVDFEIKFAQLKAKVYVFGGNDKSPTNYCQWVLLNNRRFRFDWADATYTGFSSNQLTLGEPYILKQENGYLSINGTSRQITKTNPVSDNMTIFAQGNNPDSGSVAFDGRIYYFKCTSTVDGSLVYNYISVVKNGVPCMYDTVNDIFYYNARNEGAFTAGPRV